MQNEIRLGQKVIDKITGFIGVMRLLYFCGTFLLSFIIQYMLYEILMCLKEAESETGLIWIIILISVLYSSRAFINENESSN